MGELAISFAESRQRQEDNDAGNDCWIPSFFRRDGRGGAADDNYPKTPGEFKRVCDKAMPDLLDCDARGFETMATTAAPALRLRFAGEFIPQFRAGSAARLAELVGKPIDWKFLGRKKIGGAFRQYMYLCRYDRGPVVWGFRTQEKQGKWLLDRFIFEQNSQKIFDLLSPGSETENAAACPPLCGEIANLLAHGKTEACDVIKKNLVYFGPAHAQDADADLMVGRLLSASYGQNLEKCELIGSEDIGGVLGRYTYLIQWDKLYIVVHFNVYRPGEDWKLVGFTCEDNPDAILSKVALESRKPSASPQVGQAPKKEAESKLR